MGAVPPGSRLGGFGADKRLPARRADFDKERVSTKPYPPHTPHLVTPCGIGEGGVDPMAPATAGSDSGGVAGVRDPVGLSRDTVAGEECVRRPVRPNQPRND